MKPLPITPAAKRGIRNIAALVPRVHVDVSAFDDTRTLVSVRGHTESDPMPNSLKVAYVRLDLFVPSDSYDSYSAHGIRWLVSGPGLKKALVGAKGCELELGDNEDLNVITVGESVRIASEYFDDSRNADQLLRAYSSFEDRIQLRGPADFTRWHSFNLDYLGKVASASPVKVGDVSPAWHEDVPIVELEAITETMEYHAYVAGVLQ